MLFLFLACFAFNLFRCNFASNLVGYWPFNGNANDESGNNNDGTVNGATLTAGRDNTSASAYFFNGDDYISIDNASNSLQIGSSNLSLAGWFKTNSMSTGRLFSKGSARCSTGYQVRTNDANKYIFFEFASGGCGPHVISSTIINDNQWHHFVATLQYNGPMNLYIDGVLEATNNGPHTYNVSNLNTPAIGKDDNSSTDEFFTGTIDEIRIYAQELSLSDVQELYNGTQTSHPTTTTTAVTTTTSTTSTTVTHDVTTTAAGNSKAELSIMTSEATTTRLSVTDGEKFEEVDVAYSVKSWEIGGYFCLIGSLTAPIILLMFSRIYHSQKEFCGCDKPTYFALFACFWNMGDFYSDLIFTMILFIKSESDDYILFLFYVSLGFSLIPHFLSSVILLYKIHIWTHYHTYIRQYVQSYDTYMIVISVFSGFYAAVEMARSKLFYFRMFSLQLKRKDYWNIQNLRFGNTVVLELRNVTNYNNTSVIVVVCGFFFPFLRVVFCCDFFGCGVYFFFSFL